MIDPDLNRLFPAPGAPPLSGTVANGVTKYIELPVRKGTVGVQISWLDGVSSATVTIELGSFPGVNVAVAGNAWEWAPSGIAITGPAATAAGSAIVNIDNVRQSRARLKIVGIAATSTFDIRDGNKQ